MLRQLLGLLALAGCGALCTSCETSVCDGYEVDSKRCSGYQRASDADGPVVCACPVRVAPAGMPYCVRPDLSAPLAISLEPKEHATHFHFGTYPDLAGLDTRDCAPDDLWSRLVDGAAAELGCLPRDVPDSAKDRTWIEPNFSPDGALLGIFARLGPTLGGSPVATVMKCQDGDDPGWIAERVFRHVTTPFVRWGAKLGEPREAYFAQGGLHRYRLRTDQQVLVDGSPTPALIIEGRDLIARDNDGEDGPLANADHDVSYRRRPDGTYGDRYLVFISSYVRNVIDVGCDLYVTDLEDCRLESCAADADMQFCCRSALLATGYWNDLQIPTNPTISHDGSLLAFNRFTTAADDCAGSKLCAQVHVMKNPFAHSEVMARCLSGGERDGFSTAIDCRPLTTTQDVWDDARCPDHHCCAGDTVDCTTCLSVGPRSGGSAACSFESEGFRERNFLSFFDLGSQTFVAWRSYDFVGADHLAELQVYRVGVEDGEIALGSAAEGYPKRVVLADIHDSDPSLSWSSFGPAPLRRLGPPICSGGADGGAAGEDAGPATAADGSTAAVCEHPELESDGLGSACGCAATAAASSLAQLIGPAMLCGLWLARARRRATR